MAEYVRVKDKETGHHYTVTRERYDRSPELWQELKQSATNSAGDPLPPKYKTTVSTEAAKKSSTQSGQTAATSKETS